MAHVRLEKICYLEPSENFKSLLLRYDLDYGYLKEFVTGTIRYLNQKEREKVLKKYQPWIKSLSKEAKEKPHLFEKEDLEAIHALHQVADFTAFGAKQGPGRPHDIPEAGLIWNLSLVIQDSKNDTNWKDLKEILGFFSGFCPTFKALVKKDNDDLRRLKTNLIKNRKLEPKKSALFLHQQTNRKRIKEIAGWAQQAG